MLVREGHGVAPQASGEQRGLLCSLEVQVSGASRCPERCIPSRTGGG